MGPGVEQETGTSGGPEAPAEGLASLAPRIRPCGQALAHGAGMVVPAAQAVQGAEKPGSGACSCCSPSRGGLEVEGAFGLNCRVGW